MDSFDANVLIYAAATDHRFKLPVRRLLQPEGKGMGSVLLVPEVLSKPMRSRSSREVRDLLILLGRLTLLPCDLATAEVAASLGALYGLRGADAVHLATAVQAGADRFITNNKRDFPQAIEEIEIVYPDQL